MCDVTVVIPVGPKHLNIVERAQASVLAQTVRAALAVVTDSDGKGTSWARNRGIAQVQTPWVVFLDADDYLEPTYVERVLALARDHWPDRYIYTDWYEDARHQAASEPAWCGDGGWHGVTAAIPTHWVRHIEGFDEAYRHGGEDTAFYWKLTRYGCCGVRLPEPLYHYTLSPEGRSHFWREHPERNAKMAQMMRDFGGMMSGCCGGNKKQEPPAGQKQRGDVLVQVLWRHKHQEVGPQTGRPYKRASYPDLLWMHPADAATMSGVQRIETPPPPPPPKDPVQIEQVAEPGTVRRAVQLFMNDAVNAPLHGGDTMTEASKPPSKSALVRMIQDVIEEPDGGFVGVPND